MTSSNLSKWSGTLNANLIKLSHQLLFPKHDILKGRWDREISRHFWYRYRYSPLYYKYTYIYFAYIYYIYWQWHRGIEPFSTSLALSERNPQVRGGFSSQKTVRRSLDVALISLWPRCWADREALLVIWVTGLTHAKLVSLTSPCCSGWPAPFHMSQFNAWLESDLVLIINFNSTHK